MWSTSAKGFQRARQTASTDAGAPQPTASSGGTAKPSQQRSGRATGPAPPPPPAAKARGHPAPPAAGKPARRATPSPGKARHSDDGSTKQQVERRTTAAAPAQQSLKQAAAQARTERLRSALQQLRAGRGAADGSASVGSLGSEAAAQLHGSSVPVATPAPQQPPAPQPAAAAGPAAPATCTASSCETELDSDLEDLFDDVSLDLLARLRLGGQRTVQPAAAIGAAPLSQPQLAPGADGVLAAARRALREVAAEPEMPVLRRGACAVTAHAVAVPSDAGVAARTAQSGLPHSAAAMQQQLERLRSSLAVAPSLPAPTPQPGQHGSSAGRAAMVSPGGERRAELVLTRPPGRQSVELPPPMPAATPCSAGAVASHAVMAAPPSSPYSSSGGTPAARLAALLLQPEARPQPPPVLHLDVAASLDHSRRPGVPGHRYNRAQQPAESQPAAGALSLGAQPTLIRHASGPATAAVNHVAVASNPAAPVAAIQHSTAEGNSSTTWRAGGVSASPCQAGDILAEWRARRQQQAHGQVPPTQQQQCSSLADRYSRFLSLRQPEGAAAPGTGAAPAARGMQAAQALQLGGRLSRPPSAVAATASNSGSSTMGSAMLSSLPAAEPEGGDILARWRARRRQQQAQAGSGGGADDLTPLLTLRMPGAATPHTVAPRRPPAGGERLGAAASPVRQPAAGSEPGRPAEAGSSIERQLVLVAPPLPPVALRPSSSMDPQQAQPSSQLSSAVPPPVSVPCVLRSIGTAVAEQPSATIALASVHEQQLQGTGSRAAEQAAEPQEAVASSQGAVELPQSQTAAAAVAGAELALALPAAAVVDEDEQAIALQPSRPASAASSGRVTPMSSLALTSYGSAAWSPGISRLLDECIGGYFAGGSSMHELAEEAAGIGGSSQEDAEGSAAAETGAASSTGCSIMAGGAVDGSSSTAAEACPDPADLPFMSAAASPATGCEKRLPPAGGVVATARALLAEAVMLLDQPGAGRAAAERAAGPAAAEAAAAAGEAAVAVAEPGTPPVGAAVCL